jgi:hypothetical protein
MLHPIYYSITTKTNNQNQQTQIQSEHNNVIFFSSTLYTTSRVNIMVSTIFDDVTTLMGGQSGGGMVYTLGGYELSKTSVVALTIVILIILCVIVWLSITVYTQKQEKALLTASMSALAVKTTDVEHGLASKTGSYNALQELMDTQNSACSKLTNEQDQIDCLSKTEISRYNMLLSVSTNTILKAARAYYANTTLAAISDNYTKLLQKINITIDKVAQVMFDTLHTDQFFLMIFKIANQVKDEPNYQTDDFANKVAFDLLRTAQVLVPGADCQGGRSAERPFVCRVGSYVTNSDGSFDYTYGPGMLLSQVVNHNIIPEEATDLLIIFIKSIFKEFVNYLLASSVSLDVAKTKFLKILDSAPLLLTLMKNTFVLTSLNAMSIMYDAAH